MQFSQQQDEALLAVKHWYESSSNQVFRLFGFAGTGKTTLAKHLAEGIDGDVLFAAYTGKAAHVLRKKGCDGAATIHSLIYHTRDKSTSRLKQLENDLLNLLKELAEYGQGFIDKHPKVDELRKAINLETKNVSQPTFTRNEDSIVKDSALIIIDECSMVGHEMGADLLYFGTPVLVLGDPAQLPPVASTGFFTENVAPDFMLDEVHRQAAESPILRMATEVRNGNYLKLGDYGENCHVLPKGTKLDEERILSFDQILVGKNDTRYSANTKIRRIKGIDDAYPVIGDRLVCLKNNAELGLLNGAIFNVSDVRGVMDGKVHLSVHPDDSIFSIEVAALEQHFLGRSKDLEKQYWLRTNAQEFDYGYALTVHKSQGSQWDSVCVFDESFVFKEQRHRWLYTAITRAAENVTIIRM
jgi:exodeoxyribonuclease-5